MRLELTTASQSELIDIMIYINQALRTVTWRRLIIINTSEILSYKSPAYNNFSSNPSNLRTFEITLTYSLL